MGLQVQQLHAGVAVSGGRDGESQPGQDGVLPGQGAERGGAETTQGNFEG